MKNMYTDLFFDLKTLQIETFILKFKQQRQKNNIYNLKLNFHKKLANERRTYLKNYPAIILRHIIIFKLYIKFQYRTRWPTCIYFLPSLQAKEFTQQQK